MEVFVTETGFCWGIELTYSRIDKLAAQSPSIKATHRGGGGPGWDPIQRIRAGDAELIKHYPHLARVEVVDDLAAVESDAVAAIGHQGLDRDVIDAAKSKGVVVRDFKCPFIAKYDRMAEALAADGYDLIAFGKPKNHHCLYAKEVAERGGRVGLIAERIGEIEHELRNPARKWACVAQVTGNVQVWQEFKAGLTSFGVPVRVVDTVCTDSHDRQAEAAELAARVDTVVVVDDGGGATVSVFETCRAVNPNSFRYDPNQPLPVERFTSAKTVGVVCGILVPKWIIDKIAEDIRNLSNT